MNVRRIFRALPVPLVLLGVGSYAATLIDSHLATGHRPSEVRYVQVLGSSGSDRHSVDPDPHGGTLFLNGREGQTSSATWRLDPRALGRGPRADGVAALFVTAPDAGEARANNSASLALDGKTIATFRLPTPEAKGRSAYDLTTVNPVELDLPPASTAAFTFPLPAVACPAKGCTLRIVAKDVRWRIRRIGIIYTTPAVVGPALWQRPGNVVLALLAACGVAILSHFAISLRMRPSNATLAMRR